MKTTTSLLLLAVLSSATLWVTSCNKTDQDTTNLTTTVQTSASDTWNNIKDYTYEKRVEFSDSFDRMMAKSDRDIDSLSATATKDRESAVREYHDASAQLKVQLANLRASTADTWAEAKTKASDGWKRVESAYDSLMKKPAN